MSFGLIGSEARKLKQRAVQQALLAQQAPVVAPVDTAVPAAQTPGGKPGGMMLSDRNERRNRRQSEVPTVATEASKLGAFMRGPSALPAPVAGPVDDGGIFRFFGYKPDETGQELGEWLISGRETIENAKAGQLERQEADAAERRRVQQEAEAKAQRQRQRQEIVQLMGPQAGIAYDQNPTEFGKTVSERYGTNVLSQGQILDRGIDVPGSRFSAPMTVADGTDVFDPETMKQLYDNPKDPEGFTLSQGQSRFDPNAKLIASVAPKTDEGKPNNPTGLTDDQIKTEIALSKDWGNVASEWQNTSNMVERARVMGARRDAVGDLQLVIALTKLSDPGTAAREGEVQLSQQTASLVDQAANWVEKLKKGDTLLPDASRDAMIQAINEMDQVYNDFYEGVAERTKQRVEAYGFDPSRVFLGMQPKSMRPPEQPKPNLFDTASQFFGNMLTGGGQRPSPMRPGAQQQRNALPPGVTPEMWAVMDDEDKAAFQQ